jgi:putative phosphoesterase
VARRSSIRHGTRPRGHCTRGESALSLGMGKSTRRVAGRHRSERVEMPADRPLRVVIVSDTHSKPHPASVELVEKETPDVILHGGDIGELSVLDAFREVAPLIVVRGNIDTRESALPDSVDITFAQGGEDRLKLFLIHRAVYGPRLLAEVAGQAQEHGAQLVVCGHSHVPFIGRDRGMTVFNPGSIGPRRMHLPITFGVLEVGEKASLRHMSCETGQRWSP